MRGRRARRRWAVGLVLTVVVAGAVAGHLQLRAALGRTRTELRAASDELTTTEAELVVRRASAQRARAAITETEASTASAGRSIRATSKGLTERTAERDWMQGVLDGKVVERDGVASTLLATSVSSWLHGGQIGALETCLAGIARATDRRAVDDRQGAVLILESVSSSCQQAEAGVNPPGSEAAAFAYDFADPHVLRDGGNYYAYATNGGGGNVQLIRSGDLRTWTWVGDALPQLPAWAAPHLTWAPSVLYRGTHYVLYYTARERTTGKQCLSTAIAASPTGPFVDGSTAPFLCQRDLGGSIDASAFVDAGGAAHLLWKSEGETVGGRAELWASRLAPDGLSLVGPAQPLLRADQPWESRTVEGPAMVADGGAYYLLYSGSSWNSDSYGIGFARCASPLGPCAKPQGGPAITSHGTAVGPGGQDVVRDSGGGLWLTFHAWTEPNVGYPNRRTLRVERLSFPYGAPVLAPA